MIFKITAFLDTCCLIQTSCIVKIPDRKFMGPTWGPLGSCRPQMGPMWAPWTLLLSGMGTCVCPERLSFYWSIHGLHFDVSPQSGSMYRRMSSVWHVFAEVMFDLWVKGQFAFQVLSTRAHHTDRTNGLAAVHTGMSTRLVVTNTKHNIHYALYNVFLKIREILVLVRAFITQPQFTVPTEVRAFSGFVRWAGRTGRPSSFIVGGHIGDDDTKDLSSLAHPEVVSQTCHPSRSQHREVSTDGTSYTVLPSPLPPEGFQTLLTIRMPTGQQFGLLELSPADNTGEEVFYKAQIVLYDFLPVVDEGRGDEMRGWCQAVVFIPGCVWGVDHVPLFILVRMWGRRRSAAHTLKRTKTHKHKIENLLQWRHNERDDVSNHQPHDCLLNCLFSCRSNFKFQIQNHFIAVWNINQLQE